MFLVLAILFAIAWIGGFTILHVSSAAIHLLLVVAIISAIFHFARGRSTA